MDAQTCTQCNIEKPMLDFYYSKNNQRGHATICLLCVGAAYERTKSEFPKLLIKTIIEQKTPEVKVTYDRPVRKPREIVVHEPRHHGYVYLLISGNGLYKIGRAKNIKARLVDLNREIPINVSLVHAVRSTSYILAELFMHKKFANRRVKYEWFRLSPKQVKWICDLNDFGIDEMALG